MFTAPAARRAKRMSIWKKEERAQKKYSTCGTQGINAFGEDVRHADEKQNAAS